MPLYRNQVEDADESDEDDEDPELDLDNNEDQVAMGEVHPNNYYDWAPNFEMDD